MCERRRLPRIQNRRNVGAPRDTREGCELRRRQTRKTGARSSKPRRRPKLGDVIEFTLSNGRLAYAQYVNNDRAAYGPLIRVLPGFFDARPADFSELVNGPERYYTFYFLGQAVRGGDVRIVANEPIPESARAWPTFKQFNQDETGKRTWFLCDVNKSRKVGTLSPEHYDLPMRWIPSIPQALVYIESGWHPRDEVE